MVMQPSLLLLIANISAVGSIALLRFSWGLPDRRTMINAAAWGLAALAAIAAWSAHGAWGVSVASLWAMAAAALLLGYAAWRAPAPKIAKRRRQAAGVADVDVDSNAVAPLAKSTAQAATFAPAPAPRHMGRRLLTFLLVGVAPLILSIGVAVALRAALDFAGWSEVNALVAALSLTPLLWTWLCYDLLIKTRAAQWRTLAIYALPGLAMLIWGWMK